LDADLRRSRRTTRGRADFITPARGRDGLVGTESQNAFELELCEEHVGKLSRNFAINFVIRAEVLRVTEREMQMIED